MDWLRRNWLDSLIGVALIAVITMIVVTLISGGSLVSLVRQYGPPEVPITTTTNTTGLTSTLTRRAATTATGTAGTNAAQVPNGDSVLVPDVASQPANNRTDSNPNVSSGSTQDVAPHAGTQRNGSVDGAAKRPPTAASAAGRFRVAAGATTSRDAAKTLAQSYRDDGYEVTVEQQDDFYALWVGPYTTRADADSAAERIITDGGDALVYNYDGN